MWSGLAATLNGVENSAACRSPVKTQLPHRLKAFRVNKEKTTHRAAFLI
jgi:hypothetical protein